MEINFIRKSSSKCCDTVIRGNVIGRNRYTLAVLTRKAYKVEQGGKSREVPSSAIQTRYDTIFAVPLPFSRNRGGQSSGWLYPPSAVIFRGKIETNFEIPIPIVGSKASRGAMFSFVIKTDIMNNWGR